MGMYIPFSSGVVVILHVDCHYATRSHQTRVPLQPPLGIRLGYRVLPLVGHGGAGGKAAEGSGRLG